MAFDLTNYEDASVAEIRSRMKDLKSRILEKMCAMNNEQISEFLDIITAERGVWEVNNVAGSKERLWNELLWYQSGVPSEKVEAVLSKETAHTSKATQDAAQLAPTTMPTQDCLTSTLVMQPSKVELSDLPDFPRRPTVETYIQWIEDVTMEFDRCSVPPANYLSQCRQKLKPNLAAYTVSTWLMQRQSYRADPVYRANSFNIFLKEVEPHLFRYGMRREIMRRLIELPFSQCRTHEDIYRTFKARYDLIMKWYPPQRGPGLIDARERDRNMQFFMEFKHYQLNRLEIEAGDMMAEPWQERITRNSEKIIQRIAIIYEIKLDTGGSTPFKDEPESGDQQQYGGPDHNAKRARVN